MEALFGNVRKPILFIRRWFTLLFSDSGSFRQSFMNVQRKTKSKFSTLNVNIQFESKVWIIFFSSSSAYLLRIIYILHTAASYSFLEWNQKVSVSSLIYHVFSMFHWNKYRSFELSLFIITQIPINRSCCCSLLRSHIQFQSRSVMMVVIGDFRQDEKKSFSFFQSILLASLRWVSPRLHAKSYETFSSSSLHFVSLQHFTQSTLGCGHEALLSLSQLQKLIILHGKEKNSH